MTQMSPGPWIKCQMIPLGEFRTHIARLAARVAHLPERILLTKHGRPFAAVVSMRDLEMIERFDGRSAAETRREFDTMANRFAAAQEAGADATPSRPRPHCPGSAGPEGCPGGFDDGDP